MHRTVLLRLAACFVLGAVIGTFLDGIHAYGDVLSYPDPAFGRWAFFVPIEFGLLAVLVGLLAPALERTVGGTPVFRLGERLRELAVFTSLYVATALVSGAWNYALALALVALAAARLAYAPTAGDVPYVLLAAVLGPIGEALLSALGAFDYSDPDVLGIPIWLPALWANGGFLIRRLIVPIVMPSGAAAREQAGIVGDHAGDAELPERLDPAAVVDGPDV
jgi:hypothetical protein